MKVITCTAAMMLLLALPAAALALATESFGNAPVVKQPGWADGVLEAVNLKSRVYSIWVNGNENFYFQGDADALNEALRKYAAIKGGSCRLILLPGPGKRTSFERKTIDFDWQLQVPSGIYAAMTKETQPVLTVYLSSFRPRGAPDKSTIARLIGELDDDTFERRQKAQQALEKLGHDAKPYLREALKAKPALEPRRRLEALLKRLPGIDAGDLEVPKGVTAVGADELLAAHIEELKHADPEVSGRGLRGLRVLSPFSDKVVSPLTEALNKGRHEYVRRYAASCLGHMGARAKPALAALKEGLDDRDANVRNAFKAAVEQIEKATADPVGRDEEKRRGAILNDIRELTKPASKKE